MGVAATLVKCLFVLRFYSPVNLMGSCWVWSVYLTTLLLAGLVLYAVNQYYAHSFTRNWQLSFLNQRKWENERRKYSMIKSPRKNVADGNTAGIIPSNSWSTVGPTSNSELSQWSWPLVTQIGQTNFHSPTPSGFMWNLAMICPVVSEEKKFEAFSLYESMKTSDPWGRAIFTPGL